MHATRTASRYLGLALLLVPTTCAAAFAADPAPARANVSVRISGTSRTGRSGVAESASAQTLEVGQTVTIGAAGDFDGAMASGGWPVGDAASIAWRVEARLLRVSFETTELSITWRRYEPAGRGGGAGPGDTRVLRLSAGQRHVLDLVQSGSPTSALANLFVEITAARTEDARDLVIMEYDFWLVHESGSGKKTTSHQSYGSYDSAKAAFDSLTFGFDGSLVPGGANGPVAVSITATLTGRLRPDGNVEVTLGTEAWLQCGAGRSGGAGVKEFIAKEGETVSVELPASFGSCTVTGTGVVPPGARPGVTATGDGLRVSSPEFFDGDRFSLLVRVRRFQRPPR
jgi:hypothetical protein